MEEQPSGSQQLEGELMQMGFEIQKIRQALKVSITKEQAVNYLINPPGNYLINPPLQQAEMLNEDQQFQDQQEQDYKMMFVVRMDLKLALGKIAEFVATAALKAYKQMEKYIDKDQLKEYAFFEWTESGQKKIVVKAPNEEELLKVVKLIDEKKINYVLIHQLPSKLAQPRQENKNTKPKRRGKNKEEESKKQKDKQEMQEQINNQGNKICSQVNEVLKNENKKGEEKVEIAQKITFDKKANQMDLEISNFDKQSQICQDKQKVQKIIPLQPEKQILVLAVFGPAAQSQLTPLTKHLKLL